MVSIVAALAWSPLTALGAPSSGSDELKAYQALNTADGWIEYLASGPPTKLADQAHAGLANTLRADPRTGVKLGTMTQVECSAGALTLDEMADHAGVLGSKWKYYCDKGPFTYTIANPTGATLFVRAKAYGHLIDAIIAPGKAATGTLAMKGGCNSGAHRFSAGRVTFGCRAEMNLVGAGVVTDELVAHPDILRTQDAGSLRAFLAAYPRSYLAAYVKERLSVVEKAEIEALRAQIGATAVLGPAPARLIDPRPYTLVLENPSDTPLVVTIAHESNTPNPRGPCPGGLPRCSEMSVGPGASAELALFTAPSKDPAFEVLAVRPYDPNAVVAEPAVAPRPTKPGTDSPWHAAGTDWVGIGIQSNGKTWPVEMSFSAGIVAGKAGTVRYPSLSCKGTLKVKSVDRTAGKVTLREDITTGSRCVDGGVFELTAQGDDMLAFQWAFPNGKKGATGSLSRR